MATGKRYYWIKLKDSFMTSETVDFLMSQPNGANYVVIYQMLCLKTINTDGRMARRIGEMLIPYDVPKLQRDLKWFSTDTIRVALELYKALGLVYEDVDHVLMIAGHNDLVGSETDFSAQKRRQRGSLDVQATKPAVPVAQAGAAAPPPEPPELENVPAAEKGPAVISLTLNDKTEYPIYQCDVDGWAECYPAVDIMQELRKMKGWCTDNPSRRKTKRGIRSFISRWLAKEQDKGGGYRQQVNGASGSLSELQRLHRQYEEEDGA
ncbi:MAG: phage replisome organizer N-terminal domain-containing protein [Oscillospiraceae bacterium]|nr:phage replisome organizer N-terminal domain-containing protein [Oscillospiraceae bacterium]